MASSTVSQVDALIPNDPRVQHLDFQVGSYNYHYILANPASGGEPVATVLLVHGWPDLGMAWRYQVPYLMSLNLRVIVPDMLGYGRTSAPYDAAEYTHKKIAGHIKALAEHVVGAGNQVILGGHDWGAAQAWRTALWHPETVQAAFTLNVPYQPPTKQRVTLEQWVAAIPTFGYQLQLASPEAERIADSSETAMRGFLSTMYGGRGPNGEAAFSVAKGLLEEHVAKIGPPKDMTPEMLDFYVNEYRRNGLHGPTNWYRTKELNWADELPLTEIEGGWKFKIPGMVVMGEKDLALPPPLADGMEDHFEPSTLLRKEVAMGVGHWAMWQDPNMINNYIGEFLQSLLGDKIQLCT